MSRSLRDWDGIYYGWWLCRQYIISSGTTTCNYKWVGTTLMLRMVVLVPSNHVPLMALTQLGIQNKTQSNLTLKTIAEGALMSPRQDDPVNWVQGYWIGGKVDLVKLQTNWIQIYPEFIVFVGGGTTPGDSRQYYFADKCPQFCSIIFSNRPPLLTLTRIFWSVCFCQNRLNPLQDVNGYGEL